MSEPLRLIFAGEGGQGAQTAASVLAEAAYESDLEALYIPNFGVEQRGGVSVAHLQIGPEPIVSPKFAAADVAVAYAPRAVARIAAHCHENTTFIYIGEPMDLPQPLSSWWLIDRRRLAGERINMVSLGLVLALTEIVTPECVLAVIGRRFGPGLSAQSLRRGLRLPEEGRP